MKTKRYRKPNVVDSRILPLTEKEQVEKERKQLIKDTRTSGVFGINYSVSNLEQKATERVMIKEVKSFIFRFQSHRREIPDKIQLIENGITKLSHAWVEKSIINNPPWVSEEELKPYNLKATDFGYCSYVRLAEYQRKDGTYSIGFVAPTEYECIEFSLMAGYYTIHKHIKQVAQKHPTFSDFMYESIVESLTTAAKEKIEKSANPDLLRLYLSKSPFYQYLLNFPISQSA